MGNFYDEIPESHFEWIEKQHMFFVATAPLNEQGHVNLSPKGTADCFHVVNSRQVWYEDLTGSGVETISHIRENGRITVMFCAFEGAPRVLRLFGVGTVHEYGSPGYNTLISPTTRKPGSRAVITIYVYQVGASCGFSVPFYDFVTHRTQLERVADKFENGDRLLATSNGQQPVDKTIRGYWLSKNACSLDGLPGLLTAPDAVLQMAPQSNFDQDAQEPIRFQNKGLVDGSRNSAVNDKRTLALGFFIGAFAMPLATKVLGMLQG